MSARATTRTGGFALRAAVCGASALVLALALAAVPPAYAAGGVQCTGFAFQAPMDVQSADPAPGAAYYLCVEFDKNVSFAIEGHDDSFIEENLARVHLRKADGAEVAASWTRPAFGREDRQLIYVWIDQWLDPLTAYQVVVDPGVRAANGEDVSENGYAFDFKTSDRLENGWSVFQVVGATIALGVLAMGAGLQIVRAARRR